MTTHVRPTTGDSSWFVHDRFGLFIHWGLYAMPARHEWVQSREHISPEDYRQYFDAFNPDLYNPDLWAEAAARAGMKYFVITTKHHEGFCLWDSPLTSYKAPNTACGRDLLTPLVNAFRKRDFKTGFYYSLIDWHHPDFVIDGLHPLFYHPERKAMNLKRDQRRYIRYLHAQVRDLLTNFGKVDIAWFDYSYTPQRGYPADPDYGCKGREAWDSEKLLAMVRELQPHMLINDRLDLGDEPGGWDILTPEQVQPQGPVTHKGQPAVWEACQTFSGSWGYHRDESTWRSVDMLVKTLIDTVSKDGNLLLNVGPDARGRLDARVMERLNGIGDWMTLHGRSIYGCGRAPDGFTQPIDCRLTWNADKRRLYVHVFSWPYRHLHLPGMADRVAYAQFLNDSSEIKLLRTAPKSEHGAMANETEKTTLTLELPVQPPAVTVPVIELFVK